MDYKVLSANIEHPLLLPVLNELIPVFEQRGIKFYLIGAVARDIILDINHEKSHRVTLDLDIAIAVDRWQDFKNLSEDIIALPSFTKDPKQQQRFLFKEKFPVDIVPYGGIKDQHDKIFWPPDQSFAMSVVGFEEAEKALLKIHLDDEINFEIVSLTGIFLLKLFAWKDRSAITNKDADDIGFMLTNYLNINRDLSFQEPYNHVYEVDNYSDITAGAIILGMHLNELLNTSAKVKIDLNKLLVTEIQKAEESKLINQIIETNRNLKFDEVKAALHLINDQIK